MKKNNAKALILTLLQGTDIEINGARPADIQVHDERVYQRVLQEGSVGFGESYMDGWWDCQALDQLFAKILRARLDQKIKYDFKLLAKLTLRKLFYSVFNAQSKSRAYIVGQRHYDIGNDLYSRMLDVPTMSYTCAYWQKAQTLAEAQLHKLELVCQKLRLEKGMRVLDIGCGFGGFAKYAAEQYGVEVVGLTISKEQQRLAMDRCQGLPIEIRLQDYRELNEKFDRAVSIGMFEHVGAKNYATYMRVVANCLKDDEDLFLLHTIGGNVSTLEPDAWINKYIFPNGNIPSVPQIAASFEGTFVMEDWHNFGPDYAKTLLAWHENFVNHYDEIKENYDPRFYRMWRYYLLSCAGGFAARDIQLWQIVLSKAGITQGYAAPR